MTKKLHMYFKNTSGKTVALSLEDPKDGLTSIEVKTAMDALVQKNVIESSTGKIVSAYAAKIVTTETTDLDLE